MKLLDLLAETGQKGLLSVISQKASPIPLLSKFISSGSGFFATSSSRQSVEELYQSWVSSCVDVISESVADIELILVRTKSNGEEEIVMDHPAIDLLHTPNDQFTQETMLFRLQANLELRGNEYWFIPPAKRGDPQEIFPLMPQNIKPVADARSYVAFYKYTINGKTFNIPKENIVHFKNYNPASDIIGVSTLHKALMAAQTDDYARKWNKTFFENDATPGVILEYPGTLTPDQVKLIKGQWKQQHQGPTKNHKLAVAANGLKITKMEMSHADMQFAVQRQFSRDEIFAIFRVPKDVVGITEDVNRATAVTTDYKFAKRTTKPKMKALVGNLNKFYLPLFNDPTLKWKFKDPVPRDKEEMANYYRSGLESGWLTHNEVRRMEGMTEIVDGDKTFIPFNWIPQSSVAKKAAPPEKPSKKDSWSDEMASKMAKAFVKKEPEKKEGIVLSAPDMTMDKDLFETIGAQKNAAERKRADRTLKTFFETSEKLFERQKSTALTGFNIEIGRKDYKASTFDVLDYDLELKATLDLFTPLFLALYEQEGQRAFDFLGIESVFQINSPEIRSQIMNQVRVFSEGITETTLDGLRNTLIEGVEAGESIGKLADRIKKFTGFNSNRSEMIARTEVIRAQGKAELIAWTESGLVKEVIWYTALDERVCKICEPLHSKQVKINKAFLTVGEMKELKLDPNYDGTVKAPPAHPQCRCTLIPVINDKSFIPKKYIPQDDEIMKQYLENL